MRVRTGTNRFLVVGALLVGIVGLGGCATKRFVGEEVSKSSAASERRISEVQTQVEAAQSRVREHDTHLAELDRSTRGGGGQAGRGQVRLLARPLRRRGEVPGQPSRAVEGCPGEADGVRGKVEG